MEIVIFDGKMLATIAVSVTRIDETSRNERVTLFPEDE